MESWAQPHDRRAALRPRRSSPQSLPAGSTGAAASSSSSSGMQEVIACTARLALHTERLVRNLQGLAVRTVQLPEPCALSETLGRLAAESVYYS